MDAFNAALKSGGDVHTVLQETCSVVDNPGQVVVELARLKNALKEAKLALETDFNALTEFGDFNSETRVGFALRKGHRALNIIDAALKWSDCES